MENQTNQPAQQPQAPPAPQGKKTNVGLIILIIVLVVIVLGGVGGCLIYTKAKKALKNASTIQNAITNSTTSTPTTGSSGTPGTSGGSATDVFAQAKDNMPTDTLSTAVNNDLKPVLTQLFSAAKLTSFAATSNEFASLAYTTKKAIANTDTVAIESAMAVQGYTKTANETASDGFMLAFSKNDLRITLYYQLSSPNELVVGADRNL